MLYRQIHPNWEARMERAMNLMTKRAAVQRVLTDVLVKSWAGKFINVRLVKQLREALKAAGIDATVSMDRDKPGECELTIGGLEDFGLHVRFRDGVDHIGRAQGDLKAMKLAAQQAQWNYDHREELRQHVLAAQAADAQLNEALNAIRSFGTRAIPDYCGGGNAYHSVFT